MSLSLDKLLTTEEEDLKRRKANSAELEAHISDRELGVVWCVADLVEFENHYLQKVGRPYVMLDNLKAKSSKPVQSRTLTARMTALSVRYEMNSQ